MKYMERRRKTTEDYVEKPAIKVEHQSQFAQHRKDVST